MGSWIIGMAASVKDNAAQQESPAAGATPAGWDRRRPGRPDSVNPALIPLLRREQLLRPQPAAAMALPGGSADDLAPSRGIAVSAAIGALLWVSIGAVAWWLCGL